MLVIGGEAAAPLLAAGGSEGGDKAEFDLSRASTIAEARRRLETASYDTILMNLASSQVAAAFPEELYALASASPVVLFNQSADGHDGAGQARLRLPLGAPATRALSAESHRHFGQLLEAVPDALIVTNQDNEVAFVNRAAHELFGKARDDFIGERVSFAVSEGAVS
ncbi:MAG: PAS domain-containing protein, partial [Bradyrhizobium sp.]|nr:PAS domain-containing protein [Bradyrhizobium sp.]